MSLGVYQCDDCGAITTEKTEFCELCYGELFQVYALSCDGIGGCGMGFETDDLDETAVTQSGDVLCPNCNFALVGN